MSLRSFIGLCEHRWQDAGQIDRKVRDSGEAEGWRLIEIRTIQRCTICGIVRSVKL